MHLKTKIDVSHAVVFSILLYSCETWTIYRRHIHSLDKFHLRCLRQITDIKWQDKIPNTKVLAHCEMTGIEAMLVQTQVRWSGHLVRMSDTRLPKAIFYSQLASGNKPCDHPVKLYKDALKKNLQLCNIDLATWETTAQDRLLWRSSCKLGVSHFEHQRISDLQLKRKKRKADVTTTSLFQNCTIGGRGYAAAIGLYSHMRTHKR